MNKQLEIIVLSVKAICGVAGGALVLTENHPYISLTFLCLAAAANELILYLKIKS